MKKFHMLFFTLLVLSIGFMGGLYYRDAWAVSNRITDGDLTVSISVSNTEKRMQITFYGNEWGVNHNGYRHRVYTLLLCKSETMKCP
jgi:hypothetical protein